MFDMRICIACLQISFASMFAWHVCMACFKSQPHETSVHMLFTGLLGTVDISSHQANASTPETCI